ncbi:MAG TPA: hypothetical protein VGI44_04350 [Acidimicrobiales bacterium]|jgi:hypothetical protein
MHAAIDVSLRGVSVLVEGRAEAGRPALNHDGINGIRAWSWDTT